MKRLWLGWSTAERVLYPLIIATVVATITVVVFTSNSGSTEPESTEIAGPSTTSVSSTTSSGSSTTTTSTLPPGPPSPLNGLPVADEELLDRRVVPVKIDNDSTSPRPQSGLQDADAVLEYLCYSDSTRFLVLFHHSDSEYLGPVRSLRPTDSTIVARLGPVIFFTGGQQYIRTLTLSRGVNYIGHQYPEYWDLDAPGPHEFTRYTTTLNLRQLADEVGYPDEFYGGLYEIAPWDSPPTETASDITLRWSGIQTIRWVYEDGVYKRYANGDPDLWLDEEGVARWVEAERSGESLESVATEIVEDGHGGQLAYDVLVVIKGHESYAWPPEGVHGSPVPQIQTTGDGELLIFYGGRVLEGTWERAAYTDEFLLFDNEGNPATVPPGIPWISIFPDDYSITY